MMLERRRKKIKEFKKCPKCGNTENLMIIPGSGLTFYFCPLCHRENEDNVKDTTSTENKREDA